MIAGERYTIQLDMSKEPLGILDQPVKKLVDGQILEFLQSLHFVCVEKPMEQAPVYFRRISVRHKWQTPINPHTNGVDFRPASAF